MCDTYMSHGSYSQSDIVSAVVRRIGTVLQCIKNCYKRRLTCPYGWNVFICCLHCSTTTLCHCCCLCWWWWSVIGTCRTCVVFVFSRHNLNILLTDNAIPTVLRIISMVRFPSNCNVILHQRCDDTNDSVCISTFDVITGPCYAILLSISVQKTITIRGSRAETFGLYLHPNNIQTTRFCVPVDSLYIHYTVFCVILVIHINIELTVNESCSMCPMCMVKTPEGTVLCDTSVVCFHSNYVEQPTVLWHRRNSFTYSKTMGFGHNTDKKLK